MIEQQAAVSSELEDYLTPSEAARLLGLSYQSVYVKLRDGKLPGTKTPLGWLVSRASVDAEAKRRGLS